MGDWSKAFYLVSAGVVARFVVAILVRWLAINKNLWTSSFVLQAGGISLLLLSLFYYIIDVLGYRRWAFFFAVIGIIFVAKFHGSNNFSWSDLLPGFGLY